MERCCNRDWKTQQDLARHMMDGHRCVECRARAWAGSCEACRKDNLCRGCLLDHRNRHAFEQSNNRKEAN